MICIEVMCMIEQLKEIKGYNWRANIAGNCKQNVIKRSCFLIENIARNGYCVQQILLDFILFAEVYFSKCQSVSLFYLTSSQPLSTIDDISNATHD